MLSVKNLNNFPVILPHLSVLTVHGEGRGGGEKVAEKIIEVYSESGKNLDLIKASDLSRAVTWFKTYQKSDKLQSKDVKILCTSGPRDLPMILLCIFYRIPFAVYLQVPYIKSISWKDPVHALTIFFFLLISTLFATSRLTNSSQTSRSFWLNSEVVIPVNNKEISNTKLLKNKCPVKECLIITTACRYFPERGKGSRDLHATIQLLVECKKHNEKGGGKIFVRHYGSVHIDVKRKFDDFHDVITFCGYKSDWMKSENGPFIFLSNYEGFGLSAFEASQEGKIVFVNKAFPSELYELNSNINVIDTTVKNFKYLEKVNEVCNNYN
jgi:hypothetical protein